MNSVPLHCTVAGAGPHVALLHPVGLDLTFLQPVAVELARRYRVMCVDLRGHGQTPATPLANGLEDYADDVHGLLASRRFAPCAVVGFSFGGMVAQTLALRHPRDVSALVPCACPSTLAEQNRKVAAARGADAERGGMTAVLDATLTRWFTEAFQTGGGAEPARRRLLSDNVQGWAQAWRAIAGIDTAPRLADIRVPTLCIAGEVDVSSPPQVVAAIAAAIPGARFTTIPGAPHMLFIEQPQVVARQILAFLDEVCAAAGQTGSGKT
ncbi:MAG TPA: alpha/beta fold hydrolase [Burkholderiales bacterium]|nr:alpha/beta fold hydrolase [Burkholderiales bacterium]